MTTTALPALICCCDEGPPPPPPFGGNCTAFPDYIAENGPATLVGHLKLEHSDGGGGWVEIFSTDWTILRMDLGYPPDTPPYPIDPGGFWRAGTGGALPFAGPSGQCWRGEDFDALMSAGYLYPGTDFFDPLISVVQYLSLQCEGIPSFSASIVLAAALPTKCAKVYYTEGYLADPEDPFSWVPPISHSQACCNAGCCPEDPDPMSDCMIADVANASFVLGPSYMIEELLDGIWTLPERSRTFSFTYDSCTRTYRVTTSVT